MLLLHVRAASLCSFALFPAALPAFALAVESVEDLFSSQPGADLLMSEHTTESHGSGEGSEKNTVRCRVVEVAQTWARRDGPPLIFTRGVAVGGGGVAVAVAVCGSSSRRRRRSCGWSIGSQRQQQPQQAVKKE